MNAENSNPAGAQMEFFQQIVDETADDEVFMLIGKLNVAFQLLDNYVYIITNRFMYDPGSETDTIVGIIVKGMTPFSETVNRLLALYQYRIEQAGIDPYKDLAKVKNSLEKAATSRNAVLKSVPLSAQLEKPGGLKPRLRPGKSGGIEFTDTPYEPDQIKAALEIVIRGSAILSTFYVSERARLGYGEAVKE